MLHAPGRWCVGVRVQPSCAHSLLWTLIIPVFLCTSQKRASCPHKKLKAGGMQQPSSAHWKASWSPMSFGLRTAAKYYISCDVQQVHWPDLRNAIT